MKRIFARFGAYVLDMIIVSLIAVGLANVKYINPNIKKSEELTEGYINLVTEYADLLSAEEDYFKDSILTDKEVQEITEKYPLFYQFTLVNDYTPMDAVDDELKEAMEEKIQSDYLEQVKEYNYKINRANNYRTVILIVTSIFYFTIVQFLMGGQTFGKKLFRLRIKNIEGKEVSIFNLFIRTILVCEFIFSIADLILVFTVSKGNYTAVSSYLIEARYLYELAFIVCLIIRDDNRSIHDLLLKTKVVRYDKQGNEIEEVLFKEEKEEENALIDEEEVSTKKVTKKKSSSKKKDFVEAEKVNDKKISNKNN